MGRRNIDVDYQVLMKFARDLHHAAEQMEQTAFEFKSAGVEGTISMGHNVPIDTGLKTVRIFVNDLLGKIDRRRHDR